MYDDGLTGFRRTYYILWLKFTPDTICCVLDGKYIKNLLDRKTEKQYNKYCKTQYIATDAFITEMIKAAENAAFCLSYESAFSVKCMLYDFVFPVFVQLHIRQDDFLCKSLSKLQIVSGNDCFEIY